MYLNSKLDFSTRCGADDVFGGFGRRRGGQEPQSVTGEGDGPDEVLPACQVPRGRTSSLSGGWGQVQAGSERCLGFGALGARRWSEMPTLALAQAPNQDLRAGDPAFRTGLKPGARQGGGPRVPWGHSRPSGTSRPKL